MSTGWRLRQYGSLPSTSDLCLALAGAGEPGGLAVLAERQTSARGSRGRTWQTLPGNLALSVLLRPGGALGAAVHWALLAAVVLAEALEASGAPPLQLKWPNDVLLDGRKLGGILLETGGEGARLDWLVIGFGANLAAAPDLPAATHLPSAPRPADVAQRVLHALDIWQADIAGQDFRRVREAWLRRGPELGATLRVNRGGAEITGMFAGLSETGALLLKSEAGVAAFNTGDVLQGV